MKPLYEKVLVNVLNENVETFDSMPVTLTLESFDGNVKIPFQALTCPCRVTGTYKIDWQRYQSRWPHLSGCKFPDPAADPMVDLLIEQHQIDLHFSKCNVKGDPGEPVVRLGPLGWSCIGHPDRRTIAKEIQNGLQSIEKYREASVKAAYSGTRVQANYRVVLRQGLHSQD